MRLSAPIGFVLLAATAACQRPTDRKEGPAVDCGSPSYFVGTTEAEPSFKVDRAFRLANRTRQPVRIASVEAACHCSRASRQAYDIRYEENIPARSATDLRIGYRTAPVARFPDIRVIQVRFDGNRTNTLNLTVVAKRLAKLTVFPGPDLILRREPGKPATKTLYLVARERKDLRVEAAGPPIPGLSIALSPVERPGDLQLPASVWKRGSVLALRIEAEPATGTTTARIPLKTNQPGFEELALELAVF